MSKYFVFQIHIKQLCKKYAVYIHRKWSNFREKANFSNRFPGTQNSFPKILVWSNHLIIGHNIGKVTHQIENLKNNSYDMPYSLIFPHFFAKLNF